MKKLLSLLLLVSFIAFSQAPPQGISHRGTVYNPTTGAIIAGTQVKIRISILDGSATGTSVYSEFFTITTNTQGQYSLNIGTSTTFSTATPFNSINWGTNSKYLKVEIDPTNTATFTSPSSSYSISGSNQLMSVPYALYAQKSDVNSTVLTFKSISDLCYFVGFNSSLDNVVALVQGYYSPSDGGGGIFIFRRYTDMGVNPPPITDSKRPVSDGGIYINSYNGDLQSKGLWIRQFTGNIDVRFYGVFGYGQVTTTADDQKIQNAINYASKNVNNPNDRPYGYNNSNTVYFPNGDYTIGHLTIKSGVSLLGSSLQYTIIKSRSDSEPDLITMDPGVIRDVHISNFTFVGNSKDNGDAVMPSITKGCLHFQARQIENPGGGGLWDSTFKNIKIIRFTGNSISFEGGGSTSNYQLPNQFITMDGVQVESVGELSIITPSFNNNFHALNLTGQNGQFSFTNCRFDGGEYLFDSMQSARYKPSGYNIYIGPSGYTINDNAPQTINFNTCTIQTGETGFFIDSAISINIYGCWFENFERAIVVKGQATSSKSISITNSKFLYSAGQWGNLSPNSGRVILVENSQVDVENNYIIDPRTTEQTNFISVDNYANGTSPPILGITSSGNYFETNSTVSLGETSGIMQKIPISLLSYSGGTINGLNTISKKVVFIDSAGSIYRINSMLNAGETIFLRANGGGITFYSADATTGTPGRNLYLNGRTSLTLTNGQAATFIKIDNILGSEKATYQLVSISN